MISLNSVSYRVLVGYRPPPSKQNGFTHSQFAKEFQDHLTEFSAFSGNFIITGDFNIHYDNLALISKQH